MGLNLGKSLGSLVSHLEASKLGHELEDKARGAVLHLAKELVKLEGKSGAPTKPVGDGQSLARELDAFVYGKQGLEVGSLTPVLSKLFPDAGDLFTLLEHLPLEKLRPVLQFLLPQHFQDAEGLQLQKDTAPFRDALTHVRALEAKLASLPANDPGRPALEKQVHAAQADFQERFGYSSASAPKPGDLWIDPELMNNDVQHGRIDPAKFPVKPASMVPPSPEALLFANGQTVSLPDENGKVTVVHNAKEYEAIVAKNRAAAGATRQDGTPIGVHIDLQGGGGKGKRYAPALAEMLSQGVVPCSVTGVSVGAIAAGLLAAGADPKRIQDFTSDPRLSKWLDLDLSNDHGAVFDGKEAYDTLDQVLREITGIKDRPVTFADLKMPCQIVAATMSDTQAKGDLSTVAQRAFVFSQKTTPNTPVALAIRASMAIPGVWDAVQMVDPTTGREIQLTDGGVVDGLPTGYNHDGLPTIGMSLEGRDSNLAKGSNVKPGQKLLKGNLDSAHLLWNALNGKQLHDESGADAGDYKDKNDPRAGDFMLALPIWDLTDPSKSDSTLSLPADPKVDPTLDKQGRELTREFLAKYLGDFGKAGARGTNLSNQVPKDLKFDQAVTVNGQAYTAHYQGGGSVTFTSERGQHLTLELGKDKIDAMYLDDLAYHDLAGQLGYELASHLGAKKAADPVLAA